MSDRMTEIRAPGVFGSGFAAYGLLTRSEMIDMYRRNHQRSLELAQAALAVSDEELTVETYLGPWAQKNRRLITE